MIIAEEWQNCLGSLWTRGLTSG